MSHAILIVLVFLFCTGAVLCALVAICYPRVSKGYPINQRLEVIAPKEGRGLQRGGDNIDPARKRSIEDTLRENADLAAAKAKKTKPSLAARLRQAQLKWSKTTYYAVCFVVAAVAGLLVFAARLGPVPAFGFGIAAGLLLPH
jgi:tight adherence protein B